MTRFRSKSSRIYTKSGHSLILFFFTSQSISVVAALGSAHLSGVVDGESSVDVRTAGVGFGLD